MTYLEKLTPEETAAEAHLTAYLAVVVSPDFTADDAAALEALLHDPPAPRVVELVQSVDIRRSSGETEASPFSRVATPGAGLGALTPADRKKLLRLTRAYYADPERTPLDALVALYDKTKATPEELTLTRTRRGWDGVPTWTEWATRKELAPAVVDYGHARVTGRTPALFETSLRARDASFAIYSPDLVEQVLTLFDTLPRQERRPRTRRAIRQGATFLEGITYGAANAAKRNKRAQEDQTEIVSDATREALALFRYEPLTTDDRYIVTALSNIALAETLLDESPAALSVRPMADAPRARIRILFPGYSELAKWCGASPGEDGKMPRGLTKALKHALESLTTAPRWITELVLARTPSGELEPRYRVTQALWVELTTLYPTGEIALDLHHAAVGAILKSYVERAPDLYDRHNAARVALGAREMRDEWSILEDYLLRRAMVLAGDAVTQTLPKGGRSKKAQRAARATTFLPNAGEAEGDRTVTFDIARGTLWELLKLDTMVRDRGRSYALERERDAFEFCRLTGVLGSVTERKGKTGDVVFVCTMPHPDRKRYDPDQLTMLPSAAEVRL